MEVRRELGLWHDRRQRGECLTACPSPDVRGSRSSSCTCSPVISTDTTLLYLAGGHHQRGGSIWRHQALWTRPRAWKVWHRRVPVPQICANGGRVLSGHPVAYAACGCARGNTACVPACKLYEACKHPHLSTAPTSYVVSSAAAQHTMVLSVRQFGDGG